MLDTLITNKTRIKLLLRFFLNSHSQSYLRNLENEFDVSTNAIRLELNRFEEAGLLLSKTKGNRKIFQANTRHPLFPEIHNILLKYIGFDQVVDRVVKKLGGVRRAYIIGELARGNDAHVIELMLIGKGIDHNYLVRLADKTSVIIKRRIDYSIHTQEDEPECLRDHPEAFLIWKAS
jgi:hypothetical protein